MAGRHLLSPRSGGRAIFLEIWDLKIFFLRSSKASGGRSHYSSCEPWACSIICFLLGTFQHLEISIPWQGRLSSLHCPARQRVHIRAHLSLFHEILLLGNMVLSSSFIPNAILFSPRHPLYLSPQRRERCGMNVSQIILAPLWGG